MEMLLTSMPEAELAACMMRAELLSAADHLGPHRKQLHTSVQSRRHVMLASSCLSASIFQRFLMQIMVCAGHYCIATGHPSTSLQHFQEVLKPGAARPVAHRRLAALFLAAGQLLTPELGAPVATETLKAHKVWEEDASGPPFTHVQRCDVRPSLSHWAVERVADHVSLCLWGDLGMLACMECNGGGCWNGQLPINSTGTL